MNKKTLIFYFSQSGNSLYVAKEVARMIGNVKLVSIREAAHSEAYHYEGYEQVGFIMPLYFMSMPRMVWHFIEKLELKDTNYIFSVTTRAITKGRIFKDIHSLLSKKGMALDYGRYITYPDSYIRWAGPINEAARQKIYVKSDAELEKFTKEVQQGIKYIEKEGFFLRLSGFISYNIWRQCLSGNYRTFKVNMNCTNCGICTRTCPSKNIEIQNSRPKWSNKCEDCMACVQHCPQKAIYFGKKTADYERYKHPQITLDEVLNS